MKIRKYCNCGVKLERDVSDEETARKVVTLFWTEHVGVHHFPVNQVEYRRVIARLIKRRAKQKPSPSEIEEYTMENIEPASDLVQ
jgi:hypothetical protein